MNDLGLSQTEEVIILKRTKKDVWDEGEMAEYDDTHITRQYRQEMQAINEWLAEADIECDEAELETERVIDPTDRRLRRIFTRESFENGGRLFGGFWQNLNKRERLKGIEVQGERAVELDYGQMAPRILYGICGVPLPSQDLYHITGLELFRSGVKKLMNAMLFAPDRLVRMPMNLRPEFANHKVAEVMAAIEMAHPAIKKRFFTGIVHHLQYRESQILVALLLAMRDLGTVGLPIHDAVLIPSSKATQTKDLMLSLFHKLVGVEGVVTEKREEPYFCHLS